ncbi:SET domain protein 16 [Actinidia rufa]|uniref:SET domain protein 16 n=1 Tax=Actinidia rufa TaxID=165716 RepID=A0A7J0EV42_9ERIC|nr:SET domain protein 16 [Actinidia rufa]
MIYKKTLKIETPNPQRYKVEGIESAEEEEEEACSMNPKRQKTNGSKKGIKRESSVRDGQLSIKQHNFNQFSAKVKEGDIGCNGFKDLGTKRYSSSRTSLTSPRDGSSSPLLETDEYPPRSTLVKEKAARKKAFYKPEDFVLGDIVWAKSGKKCPTWPAVVIDDPLWEAPETVLKDYAWVKDGMIFPFLECMDSCQVAVHQECYGVNNVLDFTSWVCRAWGALKPTDVDTLWVHVTCAWFSRTDVVFLDVENMEPAVGLIRIPSNSFVKV